MSVPKAPYPQCSGCDRVESHVVNKGSMCCCMPLQWHSLHSSHVLQLQGRLSKSHSCGQSAWVWCELSSFLLRGVPQDHLLRYRCHLKIVPWLRTGEKSPVLCVLLYLKSFSCLISECIPYANVRLLSSFHHRTVKLGTSLQLKNCYLLIPGDLSAILKCRECSSCKKNQE